MKHAEQQIQIHFVTWFRAKHPKLLMTSAPGNSRSAKEGALKKKLGYRKGWPDIFIAFPSKGFNGLMIEFKTPTGKIDKKYQEPLLEKLNDLGYKAVICRSVDEAIKVVESYL